jgi:hypothetical protein
MPGSNFSRHVQRAVVAGATLCLLACGSDLAQRTADSTASPASAATAASASTSAAAAPGNGALTGEWRDGDEQIQWRGDRADGAVTHIGETATFGTDGRLTRDLRFTREGTLLAFNETRTQTMQSPDRTPAPMEVRIALEFAGDSVVRQEKLVDGKPTAIRSFEIDYARRHASQILAMARSTP